MAENLEPNDLRGLRTPGTPGTAGAGQVPFGLLRRPRRKHDRTKYPWRYQRLRRKLIQITVASSVAMLFLFGMLYALLSRQ